MWKAGAGRGLRPLESPFSQQSCRDPPSQGPHEAPEPPPPRLVGQRERAAYFQRHFLPVESGQFPWGTAARNGLCTQIPVQISWRLREEGTPTSFEGRFEEPPHPSSGGEAAEATGEAGCCRLGPPFPGPHPTDNLLLSPADDRSLAEEKGLRCQNPDCMDKGRAAKVGSQRAWGLLGAEGTGR